MDVAAWQEIHQPAWHETLDAVLPPVDWAHLARETECPISVRRSLFKVVGRGWVQISKGREGVSPHRVLSWAHLEPVGVAVPGFVVANSHYVSGAFTNPGQVGDDDGWRKSTWLLGHAAARVQLAKFRDAGLTVVLGGDFNAPPADMPKFWPEQVWAVNDGIDKIAVLPAQGGAKVQVLSTGRAPLNSDHDLRTARLHITT